MHNELGLGRNCVEFQPDQNWVMKWKAPIVMRSRM